MSLGDPRLWPLIARYDRLSLQDPIIAHLTPAGGRFLDITCISFGFTVHDGLFDTDKYIERIPEASAHLLLNHTSHLLLTTNVAIRNDGNVICGHHGGLRDIKTSGSLKITRSLVGHLLARLLRLQPT